MLLSVDCPNADQVECRLHVSIGKVVRSAMNVHISNSMQNPRYLFGNDILTVILKGFSFICGHLWVESFSKDLPYKICFYSYRINSYKIQKIFI